MVIGARCCLEAASFSQSLLDKTVSFDTKDAYFLVSKAVPLTPFPSLPLRQDGNRRDLSSAKSEKKHRTEIWVGYLFRLRTTGDTFGGSITVHPVDVRAMAAAENSLRIRNFADRVKVMRENLSHLHPFRRASPLTWAPYPNGKDRRKKRLI